MTSCPQGSSVPSVELSLGAQPGTAFPSFPCSWAGGVTSSSQWNLRDTLGGSSRPKCVRSEGTFSTLSQGTERTRELTDGGARSPGHSVWTSLPTNWDQPQWTVTGGKASLVSSHQLGASSQQVSIALSPAAGTNCPFLSGSARRTQASPGLWSPSLARAGAACKGSMFLCCILSSGRKTTACQPRAPPGSSLPTQAAALRGRRLLPPHHVRPS